MSKELYDELSVKLSEVKAKLLEAQAFADQHGLIVHFDVNARHGASTHYIPNVPLAEIKEQERGYTLATLTDLMDYYSEDGPEAAVEEYNHSFRGKWVSSSAYCP